MVTTDTGGSVLDALFVNTARRERGRDKLAYRQGRSNKGLQIKT